jgi:hypothetical protein
VHTKRKAALALPNAGGLQRQQLKSVKPPTRPAGNGKVWRQCPPIQVCSFDFSTADVGTKIPQFCSWRSIHLSLCCSASTYLGPITSGSLRLTLFNGILHYTSNAAQLASALGQCQSSPLERLLQVLSSTNQPFKTNQERGDKPDSRWAEALWALIGSASTFPCKVLPLVHDTKS